MRGTLRFLVCLGLSGSIGLAAIPMELPVPPVEKAACCAKTRTVSTMHDCEQPTPKPDQDKQCCAFCALGPALPPVSATTFFYPPVGEESFPAYISSEHSHPQRPPVPPPRA
ncbi:MAG TPA: hypothetical protein VGH00_05470 [Chthoniobacterales bacterium]